MKSSLLIVARWEIKKEFMTDEIRFGRFKQQDLALVHVLLVRCSKMLGNKKEFD